MPTGSGKAASQEFSLRGYQAIVEAILDQGYEIRDFPDADPGARHVILRHDIDITIDAAVEMAELERTIGARATYFVLVRTDLYNPFSKAGCKAIKSLIEKGHRIGLHFDASLYPDDQATLRDAAETECDLLQRFFGIQIQTVSLHRPAKSLLRSDGLLGSRRHAYESRFMDEMGYCADSRGRWGHGHPLDHDALKERRGLQLLTHPIWWTGDSPLPIDRLGQFFEDRNRELDRELADNCSVWIRRFGDV